MLSAVRGTDICYSQRTTYSVHMTLGRPAVISGQSVDIVGSWFPSMYIGLKLSFQNNAVLAITRNGRWCQITALYRGPVYYDSAEFWKLFVNTVCMLTMFVWKYTKCPNSSHEPPLPLYVISIFSNSYSLSTFALL